MTKRPRLSVVVPVFNQAASIIGNLEVVRSRLRDALGDDFEIVVVSDGSIDATEDELVSGAPAGAYRVFHYDRNLGKGYAVRLGALEAQGRWIGFIDADLDLDPRALATYVLRAEDAQLDFAIGSKRHPESQVFYPRSRVVASWCFQQLVRLLFRLNVRDTQAGLKVFRREVAEQVMPLLLVKRYAFDIELLAVARAFGFSRIEELPITLDYRFSGSGVRSRAVLRAVIDTAAIFYRLRILRYYQRRRRLAGPFGFTRPRDAPSVSVLVSRGREFKELDFPGVDVVSVDVRDLRGAVVGDYQPAVAAAGGEVVAILEPAARPAGNWLSATTPFLARPEIGAVVTPKMAPVTGNARERAAAGVTESRVGVGLGYFRHTPGNIRYVREYPASAIVVRRSTMLTVPAATRLDDLVAAIARQGELVLYTPEAVVVSNPPPLFAPHLGRVWDRASSRGSGVRRGDVRVSVVPRVSLAVGIVVAVVAAVFFELSASEAAGVAVVVLYAAAVLLAAAASSLRHQSFRVGALVAIGIVLTHLVYVAGFLRGVARG